MNKRNPRLIRIGRAACASIIIAAGVMPVAVDAQSFDEQREAIAISPSTQSEQTIMAMLQAGLKESKPTQAIAVAQQWLRQNVAEDPKLLYYAGQAAELSGDWNAAVTLYRQYLQRADLNSKTADDAILAVYALLVNYLQDSESAYQFGKTEGNRLVRSARARQFSGWFLNQARSRGDQQAVAQHLLALLNAGVSQDLIATQYEDDFLWLLQSIQSQRLDQTNYSPDFVATVKALANAIKFNDELKLLLAWEVAVKNYNAKLLAGEKADPPLADAQALLERFPRHALNVQTDWAGSRGRHYRGDHRKYWSIDTDAKLAPVKQAVAKLDPQEKASYYQSWMPGYYDGGPNVASTEMLEELILQNPDIVNQKFGPAISLSTRHINPETAQKLAPVLANNPSPEVAYIRALAAAGEQKDLDKAIDVLLNEEAWRLGARQLNGEYADHLWHATGRPDGSKKRDQLIAKTKKFWEQNSKLKVKASDPAKKRLNAFNELWKDYRSNKPKIPGVYSKLVQVLRMTPEAMPKVLGDPSVEAWQLARTALAQGIQNKDKAWEGYAKSPAVSTTSYSNTLLNSARRFYGVSNFDSFKSRHADLYVSHPLEPALRAELEKQISKNQVNPGLAFAWLNTQFPEDKQDALATAKKLVAMPSWNDMPIALQLGIRNWFGSGVMTPKQAEIARAANRNWITKPLRELQKGADVATTVAALDQVIAAINSAPVRHEIAGLDNLAALSPEVFNDPQVQERLYIIAGPMRSFTTDDAFGQRLFAAIREQSDPAVLHQTAAYLWRFIEVHHRNFNNMMAFTESLGDKNPSAAQTYATIGLSTIGRYTRGHSYFDRNKDIPQLISNRGKAMLSMGLIDIPVEKDHPAYEIYRSQAQYVIGNEDTARKLYLENADRLIDVHRTLSVPYLLWVLQYHIDNRNEAAQEELVKALLQWAEAVPTAFTPNERLALDIAYGDIALQRSMLTEAQQIFARARRNPDYQALYARYNAALRQVLVERISGDFDAALETLMELDAEKIPTLTTAAHFARAEVYYAMEEYRDSADEVAKVLERDPNHADAKILLGRVQLKLEKLIEATEVELGSVTNQASIVPGEMLKVTLNDPTLAVSSGATEIEVVVWATSGDKEHLLLRQFGDQKTKYRGEVRTALGKPNPDDRTLQIVGDDEIYYSYSEAYRKRIPDLEENRGGPIIVASDAMLMASARKLLSENEQRVVDMQRAAELMQTIYRNENQVNMDPERRAEIMAEAVRRERERLLEARVKPGNPIHLRVVDPDRGRTAEIDELAVSVSSSSGDQIGRVVLKETDTHSGQFEGSVNTAEAQAMAFGSSTQAGLNANMVISPRTDYPAWRPVNNPELDTFTVDLNDNIKLGKLQILASDQGYQLQRFKVQTAMNRQTWTTVATYPESKIKIEHPWQPNVTVVSDVGRFHHYGGRSVYDFDQIRAVMNTAWMDKPQLALGMNVAGPSQAMPKSVLTDVKWMRQERWSNPAVIYRFEAYFYEPTAVTRRFEVKLGKFNKPKVHDSQKHEPQFLIAVNGRVITSKDGKKLQGVANLRAGVQKFEIWATGWVETMGFGRDVEILANLDEEDRLVPVTDRFFDASTFPAGLLEHRNAPATVKATSNGTSFDVDFASNSEARLLRLVFVDQQGTVPSLNRLKLTTADDKTILPVAQDYAELRKNDLLEIITGDQVTVRYVDDRYVTKGKQNHERFLNVAYSDAKIEFADIEPRKSRRTGQMGPYYERLLRFVHDKPLPVVIRDADMDVSVEPDEVTCIVMNSLGDKRTVTAKETGPSTGIFRAWITPVAAATSAANEIRVPEGGTLTLEYRDQENLRPGVPYDRVATINHAPATKPKIEIAHMQIREYKPELDEQGIVRIRRNPLHIRMNQRMDRIVSQEAKKHDDLIDTRFIVDKTYMTEDQAPDGELNVVHGLKAPVHVIAPRLALGTNASVDVFVQSESARREAGIAHDSNKFDVALPGTIAFTGTLGKMQRTNLPERGGYASHFTQDLGNDYERAANSVESGTFRLDIPVISHAQPTVSMVTTDSKELQAMELEPVYGAVAKAGERIYIGVRYPDAQGKTQWATTSARVITRPMLDVMTEDYRQKKTESHVGERLFVRVVDTAADTTPQRDQIKAYIAAKSGAKYYLLLDETHPNSGVFKGSCQLMIAKAAENATSDNEAYDVRVEGLPVNYGDVVGVRYTDAKGRQTPAELITIAKGSDGNIVPFSKQYTDSDIAMRTQFSMAESFLELARRRRALGDEEQAKREFDRAKQLLAAAITQFRDPHTRAHAEYLLGNLTKEDAEATEDMQLQEDRYHAALARYMKVTGSYPDTPFASKAQFQTALIYERLNEPDIAAQEYVKLAYKYPESEHLATAMARLGTHFQRKAIVLERKAKTLLEDKGNKDAQFEGEATWRLAKMEYIKSAQIFQRLQQRFPSDDLAGKAGLRAGQLYMRAEDYRDALIALQAIVDDESYDGATLRAEAMYWAGRCQQAMRQPMLAYALYKRITYDFPESKWAAYARAQLSSEAMLRLDQDLEIKRLEAGQ